MALPRTPGGRRRTLALLLKEPQWTLTRLREIADYVREVAAHRRDVADFYPAFPQLLISIFGFHGRESRAGAPSACWLSCVRGRADATEVLFELLAPDGPLFEIMLAHARDGKISYLFPLSCLPEGTRALLHMGNYAALPDHYHHLSFEQETSGAPVAEIVLNILEYYWFVFAYYNVDGSASAAATQRATTPTWKTSLRRTYSDVVGATGVASPRSDVDSATGTTRCLYDELVKDYLRKLGEPGPEHDRFVKATRNVNIRATFMGILTDFWLCQNTTLVQQRAFVLPSSKLLTSAREVIIHCHTRTEQGVRSPLLASFRRPLYHFLRTAFNSWPLQSATPIQGVIDLWLAVVQPWVARTNSTSGADVASWWDWYVEDMAPYYTVVWTDFLRFAASLDFATKDGRLVQRVVKWLATSGLCEKLREVDANIARNVESALRDFEQPGFQYVAMFHGVGLDLVQNLQVRLQQADAGGISSRLGLGSRSPTGLPVGVSPIGSRVNHMAIADRLGGLFNIHTPAASRSSSPTSRGDAFRTPGRQFSSSSSSTTTPPTSSARRRLSAADRYAEAQGKMLTPRGIQQIQRGERTCSNVDDVPVLGNRPMPVATYEIGVLVRLFHRLSRRINAELRARQMGKYARVDLRFLASRGAILIIALLSALLFLFTRALRTTTTTT